MQRHGQETLCRCQRYALRPSHVATRVGASFAAALNMSHDPPYVCAMQHVRANVGLACGSCSQSKASADSLEMAAYHQRYPGSLLALRRHPRVMPLQFVQALAAACPSGVVSFQLAGRMFELG